MAYSQQTLVFLALGALIALALAQSPQGGPHSSQGGSPAPQGGPHENQGRTKRQVEQNAAQADEDGEDNDNELKSYAGPPIWTTCDYTVIPRISCVDCNTRLICKQVGGLVKACLNPSKPHCNNGICSAVPSANCSA